MPSDFNNVNVIAEIKDAYASYKVPDDALNVIQAYVEDVFQFNAGIFTLSLIHALTPGSFFDRKSREDLQAYIVNNNGIIYTDN